MTDNDETGGYDMPLGRKDCKRGRLDRDKTGLALRIVL